MNKAILFLNGPLPPLKIIRPLLKKWKGSTLVCADGGYLYSRTLQIKTDIIIGDLDTIKKENIRIPESIKIIYSQDQNLNDMEKALIYLFTNKYKKILIFGITGGRTDHVFSNFAVLNRHLKTFDFEIYGHEAKISILHSSNKTGTFRTTPGNQISLIPMPIARGVKTSGLMYPLENDKLEWGIREGSSNEAIDKVFSASINTGQLIIFENY